jgi:hypothetical protein
LRARLEDFQLRESAKFEFALRALERLTEQRERLLLDTEVFASGDNVPVGILGCRDQTKDLILNVELKVAKPATSDRYVELREVCATIAKQRLCEVNVQVFWICGAERRPRPSTLVLVKRLAS